MVVFGLPVADIPNQPDISSEKKNVYFLKPYVANNLENKFKVCYCFF